MSEVTHRLATKESIDALTEAIQDLPNATQEAADNANEAAEKALGNFANEFDATRTGGYEKGEYVTYEGKMYRFMGDHTGAWDAGDAEEVNVGTDLRAALEAAGENGIASPITEWIKGYRIVNASGTVGSAESSTNWRYCILPCKPGDVFHIHTDTDDYTAYRAWAFANSSNTVITSAAKTTETDATVTAPRNAAKIILNDYAPDAKWGKVSYKGAPAGGQIKELMDEVNGILNIDTLKTVTNNGVTFTVDKANGKITIAGTADGNALFRLMDDITGTSEIEIGGCPEGGSGNTYCIALYEVGEGSRVAYNTGSKRFTKYAADPNKSYYVTIAVFDGTEIESPGIVFHPEIYTGGKIIDLEILAEERHTDLAYIPVAGLAFVTHCGNTLFVDCTAFRMFNKETKAYMSSGLTGTYTFALATENARYLEYLNGAFAVVDTFSPYCIAQIYEHEVVPLVDRVIGNYRILQDGYIRSGSEYYINFARMPFDARMQYDDPDYKVSEKGYVFTSGGRKYVEIGKTAFGIDLESNTESLANKKILMIGDSFVSRGYIQNYLHTLVSSLQFIGTKDTQNYSYKCEGVSGSRLYYFTDPETSPFYYNGELDFTTYLAENSLAAPDYVIINSAINQSRYNNATYGSYLENLQALVTMIQTYSPAIKIYVTFGANYAVGPGSDYGYPAYRYEEVRKCCNAVYDVSGVTVVPVDQALIDELDYTWKTISYFGTDHKILSDCVHPTEAAGFKKIANMIYNYLGK